MDSLKDAFAGGLGGLGCVLAGQPLDTIKVRQQTYPEAYRSIYQTIAKTYREGGIVRFYAGCGPSVVSNVGENAVLFTCFEHCQQIVRWYTGIRHSGEMPVLHKASAGALASVFSSIVITPVERIKCKLQVQEQQHHVVQNSSGRRPQRLKYGMAVLCSAVTDHSPPPQLMGCRQSDTEGGGGAGTVSRAHQHLG